jgi:hypothetical protein
MFFGLVGYEPHESEVKRYHASEDPLRVVTSAARTSKSWSAAHDHCHDVFPDIDRETMTPALPEGLDAHRVWFVGVNFEPLKEWDYCWKMLIDDGLAEATGAKIESAQNRPQNGLMRIKLNWGKDRYGNIVRSMVEGKSANNEKSLQSEEVKSLVLAETADHERRIWDRYLSTRSRFTTWPTTPHSKADWIKEMIDQADTDEMPGVSSYRFTPHCNPTYDWSRFWNEHAKAESRVLGKILTPPMGHDCFDPMMECKARHDHQFAEIFCGDWTMESDRVIPFRWKSFHGEVSHVLDQLPDWFDGSRRFFACDYGYSDPTAALWIAMGPDGDLLIYREIYETKMVPEDLVRRVREESERHGERLEYYVGDPQKPEVSVYMRRLGLPVWDRNKRAMRDRASGFMRLVDVMSVQPSTGRPRLYVLSDRANHNRDGSAILAADGKPALYGCPRTIREWKLLRRKVGSGDQWATASILGDDHSADAIRYFLASEPRLPTAYTWDVNDEFEPLDPYDLWLDEKQGGMTGNNPGVLQ